MNLEQLSQIAPDVSQKSQLELQDKFKKIIFQMTHDLGSPLMTLAIVAENSKNLSDKERSMLQKSIVCIKEICANTLIHVKDMAAKSNDL